MTVVEVPEGVAALVWFAPWVVGAAGLYLGREFGDRLVAVRHPPSVDLFQRHRPQYPVMGRTMQSAIWSSRILYRRVHSALGLEWQCRQAPVLVL